MSASTDRVSFLGWNFQRNQGQFSADMDSVGVFYSRPTTSLFYHHHEPNQRVNKNGCVPVIGTFFAVYRIFRAIFAERRDLLVKKEDELACRALMICIGILEITWIGGVLAHGIASIYFAWSRSSQEQA